MNLTILRKTETYYTVLQKGLPKGFAAWRPDAVCSGGGEGWGALVGVWVSAGGQRHPQVDKPLLQDTLILPHGSVQVQSCPTQIHSFEHLFVCQSVRLCIDIGPTNLNGELR